MSAHLQLQNTLFNSITTWNPIHLHNLHIPRQLLDWTPLRMAHGLRSARSVAPFGNVFTCSLPRPQVEEEPLLDVHPSSKSQKYPIAIQSSSVSAGRRRSSRKPAPSKRVKIEDTGSIDSPLTSISPPPSSKPLRSRPGRIPTPAHSEKSQPLQNDFTTGQDDEAKDQGAAALPPTLPKSVPSSPTKLVSLTPSKSESGGTFTSLKIRLPGRANALSSSAAPMTTQSTSNAETGNGTKTRKTKR